MNFRMQFRGFGYASKTSTNERPSKRIITEVNGPGELRSHFEDESFFSNINRYYFYLKKEPGYISTSRLVLNAAVVLLTERDKIPGK